MGCTPIVGECDGAYNHESRRNQLVWSLPFIDQSNKTGSMEFSAPRAIPNDFFPVTVHFASKTPFTHIKVSVENVFCYCWCNTSFFVDY